MVIKKSKILVIGGAGFIGSNLCKALSLENDVFSIDNYYTGNEINHVKKVKYIRANAKDIGSLNLDYDFDYIFHFGEYSRVEQSVEEMDYVLNNNLMSIMPILEFVQKCHAVKFIYSGSSTKFGDDGKNIYESPYAFSKNANSSLVSYYCSQKNIRHAICYFYNVYGKNELSSGKYATVVAKFKKMYKANKKLTVVKPGTQKRNFTYIDDVINALIIIAKKGDGDGYGIGSSEAISVINLAKMFNADIEYLPPRKGNRMDARLVTKKTKDLGWKPKINLRDHIKEFLNEG